MGERDHDGRRRSGVWLPDECWNWLDATARRDGTSRSDLVEGLVLLGMDEDPNYPETTL
jgi:metal-responsive CopG/Arc/MetJ family transcriptional regulator